MSQTLFFYFTQKLFMQEECSMNTNVNAIVGVIRNNPKRMAKITRAANIFEKRAKARSIVVAECAAQKLKLTSMEITQAAYCILSNA